MSLTDADALLVSLTAGKNPWKTRIIGIRKIITVMLDVNRLLTRTNVDTGMHRVRAADLLTSVSSRSSTLSRSTSQFMGEDVIARKSKQIWWGDP